MSFNWLRCIVCQTDTSERTRCHLDSKAKVDVDAIYRSFVKSVAEFRAIDAMPVMFACENDQNEETVVYNLVFNRAVWHRSCHDKFSSSKLGRAKRKFQRETDGETSGGTCRKQPKRQALDNLKCIFCESLNNLHDFCTFEADSNVRRMVNELNDRTLQARIAAGDRMAIEAKYHLKCLVKLRNRYRSYLRAKDNRGIDAELQMQESRAFAELISYMESSIEDGVVIFKLSELHSM